MKLQVINEERQPESVAPKIKVFDSEADLDAALPDLKDGAIVATKEDETGTLGDIEKRLEALEKAPKATQYVLTADQSVNRKVRVRLNRSYTPVIVSTYSNSSGYTYSKPDPFIVFSSGSAIRTIPADAESVVGAENDYVFTFYLPMSSSYPERNRIIVITEVLPSSITSAEIVEA